VASVPMYAKAAMAGLLFEKLAQNANVAGGGEQVGGEEVAHAGSSGPAMGAIPIDPPFRKLAKKPRSSWEKASQ